MVTQTLNSVCYQPTSIFQGWSPVPTSQVCPPLLSPVVGRPVFRLVCSELNSRALLSNRYFVLINRKKMKQEPAQKVGSRLGEGWRAGEGVEGWESKVVCCGARRSLLSTNGLDFPCLGPGGGGEREALRGSLAGGCN